MRDPNRIPIILKQLEKVWSREPDLRIGQLIVSLVNPEESCSKIFFFEDDQLLEALAAEEERQTGDDH